MLKVGQHVTSCVMQQTTTISARLPDRDRPVHCSATDAVSRANSISGQNILQFKAFFSSWIISAQPALEVFEGCFEGIQKVFDVVQKGEGWVKIYNGQWSKRKWVVHPQKLIKVKNSFGFLQRNPQILSEKVKPFLFFKNMFLWNTPLVYDWCWCWCFPRKQKKSFGNF